MAQAECSARLGEFLLFCLNKFIYSGSYRINYSGDSPRLNSRKEQ